jgi:hypothetical protein
MRRLLPSIFLIASLGAACSNEKDQSPLAPEYPVTRSGGVLMPLAVGNEWIYVSHSADGICGTLWDDTARVTGSTTIAGDEWFNVYFSYRRDTMLLRNSTRGLEILDGDSVKLIAQYPVTQRVMFLSYSPFRNWERHQWLQSDANPIYDTLLVGYNDQTKLLCVTYNGYVPNDDSTVYMESYAPDVGLVRYEHSGKNDMWHFTYGTYLRTYTLH